MGFLSGKHLVLSKKYTENGGRVSRENPYKCGMRIAERGIRKVTEH
jgi:hypothetical protein